MKNKLSKLTLVLLCAFQLSNAQLKPVMDERIETTSIICRLAGYGEYGNNVLDRYTADIDAYFAKNKKHSAVLFAIDVRTRLSIGFDAIPSIAVRLNKAPLFTPTIGMIDGGLDKRWNEKDALEFAKQVKLFYEEANCKAFFEAHQAFYQTFFPSAQKLIDQINFEWLNSYYGKKPDADFNLVMGYVNGYSNYQASTITDDGKSSFFQIMGIDTKDEKGNPMLRQENFGVLIHEVGHSYSNPIVQKYQSNLYKSGNIILPLVKDQLRMIGYGTLESMFYEGILNAHVVQYFKANPQKNEAIENLIADFETGGFIFMGDLVKRLDLYNSNRKKYKTLDDFMPEVVSFFDKIATIAPAYKEAFVAKRPKILSIENIANEAKQVDTSIKTIKINFDREMKEGFHYFANEEANPFTGQFRLTPDAKSIIASVRLDENEYYSVDFNNSAIRSKNGYGLDGMFYKYSFSTKGYIETKPDERFGYELETDTVIFVFKPMKKMISAINTVTVAGEFNNWNPADKNYELTPALGGAYKLKVPIASIGKAGDTKMFKFVVNNSIWIQPKARLAKNISADADRNLLLKL